MASYPETKIYEGMNTWLEGLVFSPVLPIAYPNVSFTPPASGKYLRVRHLPNAPTQITLGSTGVDRLVGLYQIEVVWPEAQNAVTPMEIAGAISNRFKRGTQITHESVLISVPSKPTIAAGLNDGVVFFIPVTVRYQADVPNT